MENAIQWLHVSGLLIALSLSTIIFIRSIKLVLKRQKHFIRLGLELLLSFSLLYLVLAPSLNFVGLGEYSAPGNRIIAFLWWISLAFTINTILNEYVWDRMLVDNEVRRIPKLLTDGVSLLIYAAAIMVVMHYVYDESITVILASSGAIAFVVGLAAQPTVQEIFAGLSLSTTKALRMGDFVEIDGIYGEVYEINWRSVSLKSPNTGSLYIFPNSAIASKTILNFSEPTGLFKYWIVFYIDFAYSPELAIRTVAEALENSRYVCRDPKPDFNMLGFTTTGIEIRVRFYFDGDDPWWDAQNEVCMAIWSSLRRKGIRLGIERMRLGSGDEFDVNPWVSEKAWIPDDNITELFSKNPLFSDFDSNSLSTIVKASQKRDFTPPDCAYIDNLSEDFCYLIIEGTMKAYQVLENGKEAPVATFKEGEFIGFDKLSDNKKIGTHKLQAAEYSVVYQIEANALHNLLTTSPDTLDYINTQISELNSLMGRNQEKYLQEIESADHERKHAELNIHLRQHIDELFEKPLLHKVLHHIKPSTKEKDLHEAIIAAAALIASARGNVDELEIDYLRQHLGKLEIIKHIKLDQSISLFKSYADTISQAGSQNIKTKLVAISSENTLCKIVMGFAIGIAKTHSQMTQSEKETLLEVAGTLKMPSDIDNLMAEIQSTRN